MTNRLGAHAVVIGGSIAGLMTARVLADFFDHVTILERDRLEDRPVIHKSIPQGNHAHALLYGGEQIMAGFYPGFGEDLEALGAVRWRAGCDVAWYRPDGKAYSLTGSVREPRDLGFTGHVMSRGVLEYLLRKRTVALPNVTLEQGVAARGMLHDNGRVCGVTAERDDGSHRFEAELVIDAGGRGSHAQRWLAELGLPAPAETTIGVDFAYTSAKFRKPATAHGAEPIILVGGPPPDVRGAGLFEIEEDVWHLSLAGRFGDYPPTDEAGFMAFARSLPSPALYEMIKDAERITEITHHRFPTSIQRHYERMPSFPEGFLILGDAICSFNPVYGQGMTSASLQAHALQTILCDRATNGGGIGGLAGTLFPKAAEVISTPWILAANFDFAYPQTRGERPPAMEEGARYFVALDALQVEDIEVQRLIVEVFQLVKPLSALWEDAIRERVLARLNRSRA